MFVNRDRVKNFSDLLDQNDKIAIGEDKLDNLKNLPGNPLDCVLFHRVNDIDELESEEDEKYIFSTPDSLLMEEFNKFQTLNLFKRFGPQFTEDKIDLLFRLIWNYKTIAINRKTAKFEVYSGFSPISRLFSLSYSGGIPRKIIKIE